MVNRSKLSEAPHRLAAVLDSEHGRVINYIVFALVVAFFYIGFKRLFH